MKIKKAPVAVLCVICILAMGGCKNKEENTSVENNSASADSSVNSEDTTTTSANKIDWPEITADGINEELLLKNTDEKTLTFVATELQTLVNEEEEEEKQNPEILISEGWTRVFKSERYKKVLDLGPAAMKPLYVIIYKSSETGEYEYICAQALYELSGCDFEWNNSKDFLQKFNEQIISEHQISATISETQTVPETQSTTEPRTVPETQPATEIVETPDITSSALSAYKEILMAAPAVEGDPAVWYNAGLGYEESKAMFGDHFDYFSIIDLNKDGVPELIALTIINFRWTTLSIFTYLNGRAVLAKTLSEANDDFSLDLCSIAAGSYYTYICSENHLHTVWHGTTPNGYMEEDHAYKLNGAFLAEVDCSGGDEESRKDYSTKTNNAANVNAAIAAY